MSYVDGFVVPVPADKVDEYRALAEKAGKIWMEHGALEYKECLGEDMDDKGFCTPFPQMAGTRDNETVVFAYIVYESREHRDEVNARVMADPRMQCDDKSMPFDCKRMAYGGFSTLVDM